jgi:hypothetical protein
MRASLALAALLPAAAGAAPDFEATLTRESTSARIALESDGAALVVTVEVNDANVIVDPDPERGDHVEMWLALDDDTLATDYVATREGDLALIDNQPDPARLAAELKNPTIEGCDDAGLRAEARKHFARAMAPRGHARAAFGLVHMGLFPDARPAILYDRKLYQRAEKAAGTALGPVERGVTYSSTRTPVGYVIRARLSPDAFGFAERGGLRAARVSVDLFDQGSGVAPDVLSTSPRRRWGDPSTFVRVPFARPIGVRLLDGYPALGLPAWPKSAFEAWPRTWMLGEKGWVGLTAELVPAAFGPCSAILAKVKTLALTRSAWKPDPAAPVRSFVDADAAEDAFPDAIVVLDEVTSVRGGRPLASFRFGDGRPGALVVRSTTEGNPEGHCGAATIEILTLVGVANDTKSIDVAKLDGCRRYADLGPLTVDNLQDDVDDPGQAIEWLKPGRSLRLTLPIGEPGADAKPTRFVVAWDEHGGNVTATAEP